MPWRLIGLTPEELRIDRHVVDAQAIASLVRS
jgi:hypothetical protein